MQDQNSVLNSDSDMFHSELLCYFSRVKRSISTAHFYPYRSISPLDGNDGIKNEPHFNRLCGTTVYAGKGIFDVGTHFARL